MTLQKQIDQLIAHRASEWIEILKTGGPQEREAFVDWLRESRKHVAEFLTLAVLDKELNKSIFEDLVDRTALLKRVSPHISGLVAGDPDNDQLANSRPISTRTGRWRRPIALAASVAAAALAIILAVKSLSPVEDFVTEAGEQRAIELADGSVMQLNSASRVRARIDASSRELQLMTGEALFKVAKDARRPFRVRTRDTVVQAVGTQFNVNAREAATIVSVLEGKVLVSSQLDTEVPDPAVAATPVIAGEEALVDAGGKVDRRMRVDVEKAASWRERRLVFRRTTIDDVVHAFNRHNVVPKLRLEGVDGESLRYSAIFHADDPASFADFLRREGDVTIERRSDEIVIRPRE